MARLHWDPPCRVAFHAVSTTAPLALDWYLLDSLGSKKTLTWTQENSPIRTHVAGAMKDALFLLTAILSVVGAVARDYASLPWWYKYLSGAFYPHQPRCAVGPVRLALGGKGD